MRNTWQASWMVGALALVACGGGEEDAKGGGESGATATGATAGTGGRSGSGGTRPGTGGTRPGTGGTLGPSPKLEGCSVFPGDNPWNQDVSGLPLHPRSDAIIDRIGRSDRLHPDFGTEWENAPIGIPYVVVNGIASVPIDYQAYGDESDPGPFPLPLDAPIEGGPSGDGDRHAIAIDTSTCRLYELYRAFPQADRWEADSGAVWDLTINDTHPPGCTSADAAGLPIFPGLVRYDEVAEKKELGHAVRFTVSRSRRAYIAPATHYASDATEEDLPPMGLRVRMKASYDCSGYAEEVQVICAGMKRYGMILADNGSDWYVSGAPDSRWNDDHLNGIKRITGDAFEVVDTGGTVVTDAPDCKL